nr:hypothetical protein MACL_00002883 [Theileria orientalis]
MVKMCFVYYFTLLYYILNLGSVRSLVADDSCFAERSSSVLSAVSKKDAPLFHETLSKLKTYPFTMVVRYCLGENGNVTGEKFLQCVSSLNSCPVPWHSRVNWQFCLCNTLHCMFKGCFQHWIKTFDFTNTEVLLFFTHSL